MRNPTRVLTKEKRIRTHLRHDSSTNFYRTVKQSASITAHMEFENGNADITLVQTENRSKIFSL